MLAGIISVSIICVIIGFVLAAVFRADRASAKLRSLKEYLRNLLAPSDDHDRREHFMRDNRAQLEAWGFESAALATKHTAVARYRSLVREERSRLRVMIELMPMLGLLGTTIGIIMVVVMGDSQQLQGVGGALVTTLFGLAGAAWSKWRYEIPGDRDAVQSLELLSDEVLVARFPTLQTDSTSNEPDASVETGGGTVTGESTDVSPASH